MSYLPSIEQSRFLLGDPAPAWRWVVRMPTLLTNQITGNNLSGFPATYQGLTPALNIPFGFVERIEFNTRQIDVDHRFRSAGRDKFPRFIELQTVGISFFEDTSYSTIQYLRTWQNQVVDQNRNFGLPSLYKNNIYLFTFDYLSNDFPVMQGILVGCWPFSIQPLVYEYTAGNRITVTCEFAVDEEIINVGIGANKFIPP